MSKDKKMKVVVITEPGKTEVREISIPKPGPFEALVKTEVCGICGSTDRHLVAGKQCHHPPEWYPAVLGHEAVGKVVEVGSKVVSFKVGDRVTRPVAVWPGTEREGLYSCWGGFSQYGIVRDRAALLEDGQEEYRDDYTALRELLVPEAIGPVDASLAISLAEVASWVRKAGPLGGKTVAVGGVGFVGSAQCLFTKMAGAEQVIAIDIDEKHLKHALLCGADVTINSAKQDASEEVKKLTGGAGADLFVEAAGIEQVFQMGLGCIRTDGTLGIYGAPEGYHYKLEMKKAPDQFSVRLIRADEHVAFRWTCDLITRKLIDTSLFRTHVWDGLEKIDEALRAQAGGEVIKGFIKMTD